MMTVLYILQRRYGFKVVCVKYTYDNVAIVEDDQYNWFPRRTNTAAV